MSHTDHWCNHYAHPIFPERIGWDGKPVERTPEDYPYSYDEFFVFQSDDFDRNKASAVYSDRMMSWDFDKFAKAMSEVWKTGGQQFFDKKPGDVNRFLNLFFGKEVKLTAILRGCNVSNGYPYWIFAYEEVKENA